MDSVHTAIQIVTTAALLCLTPATLGWSQSTWTRHTIDDTLRGADGVRLADFNDDGKLDITTGWEESGVVKLYLNPGFAEATSPWPGVEVGKLNSPEDAVAWDADGDGRLEVVSCHEGRAQRILVHRLEEADDNSAWLNSDNWTSQPIGELDGQQWMFAEPIDLTTEAKGLMVASKGKQASITLIRRRSASGPGSAYAEFDIYPLRDAGWIMSLVSIDMDGDGDDDLVYSDRKGAKRGIGWLEQPDAPNQHWKDHSIGASDFEVLFLDAGRERIFCATRNGIILDFSRSEREDWQMQRRPNPPKVRFGKSVKRMRNGRLWFTANTHADADAGNSPAVWHWTPTAGWAPIDSTPRMKTDLIAALDLDGDGDLDLITCEERRNLGIVWYENPAQQ